MLKEIVIALQSYRVAYGFINSNRMWRWIIIPGIIYVVLFLFGFYGFWVTSNSAIGFLMQESGVKGWLDKMDTGWVNFLFILGQIMLQLVLLLFYFSLFKYLFLILASPVFAYLSEKTESIIEGRDFPFNFAQLLKDVVRGIRIALRNLFWQTIYLISLFLLSFIPVVGWIAPVVALFVEFYYFGFSMLDYSSERNKLGFSQSIRFIGNHKGLAIGNGIGFFVLHFIPIVGWLVAPSFAVIAATLSLLKAKKHKVIQS